MVHEATLESRWKGTGRVIAGILRVLLVLLLTVVAACGGREVESGEGGTAGSDSPVRIAFIPDTEEFVPAAREYQRIWDREGQRIVEEMEAVSGLSFTRTSYADTAITARVLERPSSSGYRERPMVLRASYGPDTKRATLIHELGHRLHSDLFRKDEEEHGPLFLWIYDVWVELYGRDFADEQVAVEKARGERYVRAWEWALSRSSSERAAAWKAILDERQPGG